MKSFWPFKIDFELFFWFPINNYLVQFSKAEQRYFNILPRNTTFQLNRAETICEVMSKFIYSVTDVYRAYVKTMSNSRNTFRAQGVMKYKLKKIIANTLERIHSIEAIL